MTHEAAVAKERGSERCKEGTAARRAGNLHVLRHLKPESNDRSQDAIDAVSMTKRYFTSFFTMRP